MSPPPLFSFSFSTFKVFLPRVLFFTKVAELIASASAAAKFTPLQALLLLLLTRVMLRLREGTSPHLPHQRQHPVAVFFLFHCSSNHQHIEGPLMVTHQALDRQNKSTNSPIHSIPSERDTSEINVWLQSLGTPNSFIHSCLALPALESCIVTIANPASPIPSPRPFHPHLFFQATAPLAIDNTSRNTANKMGCRAMTSTSKTNYPVSLI